MHRGLSIAGLALGLLAGCPHPATLGASAELQAGYTSAQQRAALAEAAVADLTERLETLEEILREQGLGSGGGLRSLDDVAQEVAEIRGRLEELGFGIRTLTADFTQYQMDQERRQLHDEARLRQLEQMLGLEPPPPPRIDLGDGTGDGGEAPTDAETDEGSGTSSPDEGPPHAIGGLDSAEDPAPTDLAGRLRLAEARMEDGNEAAARAILEALLPDAEGDPLEAEVHYRVAETWFNEGSFKRAAKRFQVVLDEHGKSAWAPWSMLRIGECFVEMGRADAGAAFFEGVKTKFPGTDAAREAAKKLD